MHRSLGVCAFVLIALATGCSDPTKGEVSGTITVDGNPAKTGSIGFFPIDGNGQTSGAKIVEGTYTATVSVGKSRVEIRVPKKVGEQKIYNTPDSPIQDLLEESLPAKFNTESELVYEVTSGKSVKDFELSTKKK